MGKGGALRQAAGHAKAVDSKLLNRLGIQVARTVGADAAIRLRRWPAPSDPVVAEAVASVRRDGFAVIEDLLTDEELARVEAAAARALADPEVPVANVDNGGVQVAVRWRSQMPEDVRSDLDLFFGHPTVLALGGATEHIAMQPGSGRCTLQHQRVVSDAPDLEAQIHSDTFQPTHKMWLYLTDVTPEDGPLAFYPGSQRLTAHALAGTYRESVGANQGSRRISEKELTTSRWQLRTFPARRNTLVIANTHGYHGRAQGEPGGERLALNIELRSDPFRRPKALPVDHSGADPGAGGAPDLPNAAG